MVPYRLISGVFAICVCLLLPVCAEGQYGCTPGPCPSPSSNSSTPTKGSYGSTSPLVIGGIAAIGGGAILYLATHKHHSNTIQGCVEASSDGNKLFNERDKKTYALMPDNRISLSPGARVKLVGRKMEVSGRPTFVVQELAQTLGTCPR